MLYMINHGAVSYGANTILTNINFEINAGQKIAVVGRNGCGKTTLLKLIEGEVELETAMRIFISQRAEIR